MVQVPASLAVETPAAPSAPIGVVQAAVKAMKAQRPVKAPKPAAEPRHRQVQVRFTRAAYDALMACVKAAFPRTTGSTDADAAVDTLEAAVAYSDTLAAAKKARAEKRAARKATLNA